VYNARPQHGNRPNHPGENRKSAWPQPKQDVPIPSDFQTWAVSLRSWRSGVIVSGLAWLVNFGDGVVVV